MKTFLIAALAVGALGLAACGGEKEDAPADETKTSQDSDAPKAKTVSLKVTGMT